MDVEEHLTCYELAVFEAATNALVSPPLRACKRNLRLSLRVTPIVFHVFLVQPAVLPHIPPTMILEWIRIQRSPSTVGLHPTVEAVHIHRGQRYLSIFLSARHGLIGGCDALRNAPVRRSG